jgi:hypothetical protein
MFGAQQNYFLSTTTENRVQQTGFDIFYMYIQTSINVWIIIKPKSNKIDFDIFTKYSIKL